MAQLKQGFCRTKCIMVRLTPPEFNAVAEAAKRARSLSDFVREKLLEAVSRKSTKQVNAIGAASAPDQKLSRGSYVKR